MFTGKTVDLGSFEGHFGLQVVRDCAFSFVGKVPSRLNRRIVPCSESSHIEEAITRPGIAGIITRRELAKLVPEGFGLALSSDPKGSAWQLQGHLANLRGFQWEDFASRIDSTANIQPGAHVAPQNVVIGAGTVVMPGAVICERSIIGSNCRIGPGTIIASDAFEVDTSRSPQTLLQQSGGVMLADYVEIGGLCAIERATFGGFTALGRETKLETHVHIAHDCNIGSRVKIAAAAGLSGRVTLGDDVFLGPNSSVSNGLTIRDRATVTLGAIVVRDVPEAGRVTGNFAVPHGKWMKFIKSLG